MRVQLAASDQPHFQSAPVRFGGLGRRYVRRSPRRSPIACRWVKPLARASPKAHRPFLGRDPPRLDAGHRIKLGKEPHTSEHDSDPIEERAMAKSFMVQ
jgi:hypothetical protein